MSTNPASTPARPDAWVLYLSGPLRKRCVRIEEDTLSLAAGDGRLLPSHETGPTVVAASLQLFAGGYRLVAAERHAVWVSGERVERRVLASGDLIELEGGPLLRFGISSSGTGPPDALRALPAEANHGSPRAIRAGWVGALAERSTQAWRRSRTGFRIVLIAFIGVITLLTVQTRDLEQQLTQERRRVTGMAQLLNKLEGQALQRSELDALRDQINNGLLSTGERVKALEAGSAAVSQVVAQASGSVAFVQGYYGYIDPATQRPLRFAVGKNGSPMRLPDGRPAVTLDGGGPAARIRFSGTAFVVAANGVLLTNRHVALPWEDEASPPVVRDFGLKPVMLRVRGYVPGTAEPFDVKFLGASDTHDLALLQGDGAAREARPLPLSGAPPAPGDTAILLGYPTGIRALLVRAGDAFVRALSERPHMDDDEAAAELARADLIKPLANRGIVGQVAGDVIVYDAQTASGGSGGPVLNVRGEVVAISRALLAEFGGSNIGVPSRHALDLLQRLKSVEPAPPTGSNHP